MRTTILTAIAALVVGLSGTAAGGATARQGSAARSISAKADAHLHYIRSSGSTLYEQGRVSGSLWGHMRAVLHVGATFTGRFTFYTPHGQIRGHGIAHPHGSGRLERFTGTDVVTRGTGRYRHAHGHGKMYGVFDRKTYAVTINTRGILYF